MEKQNFKNLYDFINRAVKSRKYPENTGSALKTALKLFEEELNEEEVKSINEVKKNIGQISNSIFAKGKFSAGSLATYKSRVIKVINEYEKYGSDAAKMANWSPKIVTRTKKMVKTFNNNQGKTNVVNEEDINVNNSYHTFEFRRVKLLIPKTPETTEAIMDGELKDIKTELKEFSEKYCKEEVLVEEINETKE
ncbi:MAG TPA: hypothetical protein VGO63_01025 [Candidatus Paceibacterota bacterium]|jgi:ribosomal protein S20|nr:hypothetical protein [Candidatus Paceibacterota bacterium]